MCRCVLMWMSYPEYKELDSTLHLLPNSEASARYSSATTSAAAVGTSQPNMVSNP